MVVWQHLWSQHHREVSALREKQIQTAPLRCVTRHDYQTRVIIPKLAARNLVAHSGTKMGLEATLALRGAFYMAKQDGSIDERSGDTPTMKNPVEPSHESVCRRAQHDDRQALFLSQLIR